GWSASTGDILDPTPHKTRRSPRPWTRHTRPAWPTRMARRCAFRTPTTYSERRGPTASTRPRQASARRRYHLAICLTQYQAKAINKATTTEPPRRPRPRRPQVTGSFRRCEVRGVIRRPPWLRCCAAFPRVNRGATNLPALSEFGHLAKPHSP